MLPFLPGCRRGNAIMVVCAICLLLAGTIALGLYPRLLMDLILPSLNGPLFEQLRQGAWR